MADADDVRLDLRDLLAAVEAAPPVEVVDVLAHELARMLDATEVSLLVANLSGTAAMRMSNVTRAGAVAAGRNERTQSVPLDGSVHHRVLTSQEQHVERVDGGWRVLVPVTERGDAIGILELKTPYNPDSQTLEYVTSAAHALAYTVIAARRHTDLFEWAQRDVPFSLPAEIQRRLLPDSYTVESGPFTLAGWLEPAATVGGDTFDYSVDREYLYASVTDAMGHSIGAAWLATLRSLMSFCLAGETTLGALNLYAHMPRAFGATDRAMGLILATHAGVALAAAVELEDATKALEVETKRLQNLQGALSSRQVIGRAEGILMNRERITGDQAFDLLRRASQQLNIKLREIAQHVVDTGEIPDHPGEVT